MVEPVQAFVGGRNRRMQELISGSGGVLAHPADWLLKVNLPPLMGRRDAAFDIAERSICAGDFSVLSANRRFGAYCRISHLLKQSCADSRQILLMLSNPDTRERERRMLAYTAMLDSLGATLANFFELRDMMMKDEFRDAMTVMDEAEAQEVISSFNSVETDLLARMQESFKRSHWRVMRYRTYAGKNFSAENSERYHRAYSVCVKQNTDLLEQLGVNLSQEIQF